MFVHKHNKLVSCETVFFFFFFKERHFSLFPTRILGQHYSGVSPAWVLALQLVGGWGYPEGTMVIMITTTMTPTCTSWLPDTTRPWEEGVPSIWYNDTWVEGVMIRVCDLVPERPGEGIRTPHSEKTSASKSYFPLWKWHVSLLKQWGPEKPKTEPIPKKKRNKTVIWCSINVSNFSNHSTRIFESVR